MAPWRGTGLTAKDLSRSSKPPTARERHGRGKKETPCKEPVSESTKRPGPQEEGGQAGGSR